MIWAKLDEERQRDNNLPLSNQANLEDTMRNIRKAS